MTWTPASSLKPGDSISPLNNRKLTVKSIELKKNPTKVYNFEVENFHSYFVGKHSAWVHNASTLHGNSSSGDVRLPGEIMTLEIQKGTGFILAANFDEPQSALGVLVGRTTGPTGHRIYRYQKLKGEAALEKWNALIDQGATEKLSTSIADIGESVKSIGRIRDFGSTGIDVLHKRISKAGGVPDPANQLIGRGIDEVRTFELIRPSHIPKKLKK
jgi:hypothetical protein